MAAKKVIEPGTPFGRWTVIREGNPKINKRGNHLSTSLCRCECGIECDVSNSNLRRGITYSCGCLQREETCVRFRTHGASVGRVVTPEYRSYSQMLMRCSNPRNKSFPNYGGRGIAVCERWKEGFANFFEDMGQRPTPQHSIDRINNDDDYCPENCRWSTKVEQANNTRVTRYYEFYGKSKTLTQWAKITQVDPTVVRARLRLGWSNKQPFWTQTAGLFGGARNGLPDS